MTRARGVGRGFSPFSALCLTVRRVAEILPAMFRNESPTALTATTPKTTTSITTTTETSA